MICDFMFTKQVVGKVIAKNSSPMTPLTAEKGSAIPVTNAGSSSPWRN